MISCKGSIRLLQREGMGESCIVVGFIRKKVLILIRKLVMKINIWILGDQVEAVEVVVVAAAVAAAVVVMIVVAV